jgi:hypothetical protein
VVEPYVPGEHREAQETEPLAAEKEARGQGVQKVTPVGEKVPGGQGAGRYEPAAQKEPGGQTEFVNRSGQ